MAQTDVCEPTNRPTVCEIAIPPTEAVDGYIAYSVTQRQVLRSIEAQREDLDPITYAKLIHQIRVEICRAGERIVEYFHEKLGITPPTAQIKATDRFSWVRGCVNPKHTDQVPATVPLVNPIDTRNYRAAIARLQKAALRAIKAGNISRLGHLIDDLGKIYEIFGEKEKARSLWDLYHAFLTEMFTEQLPTECE